MEDRGMTKVVSFGRKILVSAIIGEIEGHDLLGSNVKTTKYEHILPELAAAEAEDVDGILFLLNTIGGDVESGLAIAEMIASMSKPTVSLVLGGSHSIGLPLAVATDWSLIVPTATIMIHPVRLSGTVIGAQQTYDYFQQIQGRIVSFVSEHSGITPQALEKMMVNTKQLTKDLGTVLVGEEAVQKGLIREVGGIHQAFEKLEELIAKKCL